VKGTGPRDSPGFLSYNFFFDWVEKELFVPLSGKLSVCVTQLFEQAL
jgi:hypothetical protein